MVKARSKKHPSTDHTPEDPLAAGTGDNSDQNQVRQKTFPLIPLHDLAVLPGVIMPLYLKRGSEAHAIHSALSGSQIIILTLQKTSRTSGPRTKSDFSRIGVLAKITNRIHLSSGDLKVRFHIQGRVYISSFVSFQPFVKVKIRPIPDSPVDKLNPKKETLLQQVKEKFSVLSQYHTALEDYVTSTSDLYEPGPLADLIGAALPLDADQTQRVLEELDVYKRLELVAEFLNSHIGLAAMKERISTQAQQELGRVEHEELLREHLRQIQAELGEISLETDDLGQLKQILIKMKMPNAVKREAQKQLRRLEQLHPDTSEAALARTYIDWIVELPWSKRTKDRLDLTKAKEILDKDHYGLEKPKERILDFLGVQKIRKELKGPILLLVGPPGVGKTSLGKSIATALGRRFVRISLGGLRDEAELRGHRRTYVGALPGRVIQGLKTGGTKNPVFMFDELDKIGMDFRGDPASVLLEILDPEQNKAFEDHYLNVAFDLSEVMFICTANVIDTIPDALLDRMEIIEIAGYTNEEKLEIAKRYLIEREKAQNGLDGIKISLNNRVINFLITGYTRESGVRELGRTLSAIFRKLARMVAEEHPVPHRLSPQLVEELIGPIRYIADRRSLIDETGVVTGLAWTPTGGETLTVEVSITKGKGELFLTGQLGEVMRESAMAALTYVLSNAITLGIDPDFYENSNVHVHVPQGAIPKDGPSAGIAIATALVSLLTQRPVNRDVAMTGEITLRGNVLPVGGLREKALAAMRIGISTVVIPKENTRELIEYPQYLLENVKFLAVEKIDDALEAALLKSTKLKRKRRKSKTTRKKDQIVSGEVPLLQEIPSPPHKLIDIL